MPIATKTANESVLTEKAHHLAAALTGMGLQASVLPSSLRPYCIKVHVRYGKQDLGHINIYTGKKGFSFKLHEMRGPDLSQTVKQAWYGGRTEDGILALQQAFGRPDETERIAYHAYTDGSFIEDDAEGDRCGYGAVIVKDGAPVQEVSGASAATASRQVEGEVDAALAVIEWCRESGVREVVIFHDFANLGHWASGAFQAKAPASKRLVAAVSDARAEVRILWRKVAAHAGHAWNERADALARAAAGLG